jgi:type II secretory pathway pseudopilin PulG
MRSKPSEFSPLMKGGDRGGLECQRNPHLASPFIRERNGSELSTNILEDGYTLAGALILLAVLAIFMALAMQSWSFIKQRENEEELIFRGKEYVRAINRYHAKFNSFPPDIDTLLKQKFLRREYLDPMTKSGKWKVLRPDSLVQTGAAGQINQPGQQGQQGTQTQPKDEDKGSDNQQNQGYGPGQIPTSFSHDRDQTQTSPSDLSDAEKNSDEEPESDVVGPIVGVVSRSKKTSIRVYNNQNTYNKWYFVYALPQQAQQPQPKPQNGPGKKNPNQNSQKPPKNPGD